MKNKFLAVVLVLIMVVSLAACGDSNTHEGEAKTPSASSAQKGRDYQSVVDNFKEKGFTNIKTEILEDLVSGWMTKDGEVESVSVDGDGDYSADVWYPQDVQVVITYHTFPKESTEGKEQEESENNGSKEDTTENAESDDSGIIYIDPNDPRYSSILTIESNEELAAVLSTKDEFDSIIKDFAEKYSLYTIEFDGYISNVTQYEDEKTRLNVLVYAGDYRTDNFYGPNIQLENIGTNDYNWTKDSESKNVHIVAKVMEYREASGLLILSPESIELR